MQGRKFVVYLGTGYFCKWTAVQSLPLEKLEGITWQVFLSYHLLFLSSNRSDFFKPPF